MKKLITIQMLLFAVVPAMMAQDDMYFSKEDTKPVSKVEEIEAPAYYVGSNRDVDEYNRRGKLSSYYQKVGVDSLGNDIIEFRVSDKGYVAENDTVYPGSASYYLDDDFVYCRRLSRFDPYFYDNYPFCTGWWGPYSYASSWYYPWYDPWYSPYWHYGYYGWYDWYHGWWGGWYPHYVGSIGRVGHTGTLGYYDRGGRHGSWTRRGTSGSNVNKGFGTRRPTNSFNTNNTGFQTRSTTNSSFGTRRSSGSSFGGGSRSGGFGGGSRGGSFGGGGSRGGSFGGRR